MKVSSQPPQATDNPPGCDSQGEGAGTNTRDVFSHRSEAKISAAGARVRSLLAVQSVSRMGCLENLGQGAKETNFVSLEMAEAPRGSPTDGALGQ